MWYNSKVRINEKNILSIKNVPDFSSKDILEIFIRTNKQPKTVGSVKVRKATTKDKEDIKLYIEEYCAKFDKEAKKLLNSTYYVLEANEIDNKKIRMNQGR